MPAAYAAASVRLALWEVVLRDVRHGGRKVVAFREIANRYLVQVKLRSEITLVDISRPAVNHLALAGERPPDLTAAWSTAYPVTGQWAQCLFEEAVGACGFYYESHQIDGCCVVIFECGGQPIFDITQNFGPVTQGEPRKWLIREAHAAGAAVSFNDLPDDRDAGND